MVLAGRLSPGADFTEYLRERRVTAVSLANAFWHAWVQELDLSRQVLNTVLRLVIVGGEQVQSPLCTKWRALDRGRVRLINTYGPTETTVQATLYELTSSIPSEAPGRVPIGRPAPNVRAYVVDRHLNLLPAGAAGELCIGGSGVSRGYLGRPSLTAAAFVPDPISGDPGGRLYRTGDRVRLRSDGELEFLGRIDHQVKVRGYRVEPGEVEAVLERHPGVGECVVTVKEGASGERRLVAYVVPRTPGQWPESAELAAHLSAALPPYMLPSDYVRLAALPLTPTNKIDREALPPPDGSRRELSSSYAGPRTPMEQVIAGVWASVLKRDQVGVHDDFFSLGGHSLLATMLISRLRAELRVDLPLRSLFEAPTVAGLAAEIGRRQGQAESDEAMLLRELEDLSDEEAQRLLLGGSREAAG